MKLMTILLNKVRISSRRIKKQSVNETSKYISIEK